jgi:hypothetical protein
VIPADRDPESWLDQGKKDYPPVCARAARADNFRTVATGFADTDWIGKSNPAGQVINAIVVGIPGGSDRETAGVTRCLAIEPESSIVVQATGVDSRGNGEWFAKHHATAAGVAVGVGLWR